MNSFLVGEAKTKLEKDEFFSEMRERERDVRKTGFSTMMVRRSN